MSYSPDGVPKKGIFWGHPRPRYNHIKRWSRVKNHENHAQFTWPPPLHVVVPRPRQADFLSQISIQERVEKRDERLGPGLECRTIPSTGFSSQGVHRLCAPDSLHSRRWCARPVGPSTGLRARGPELQPPARRQLARPGRQATTDLAGRWPAVARVAPPWVPAVQASDASSHSSASAAAQCGSRF
jgi:hypothetical protein